MAYTGRSNYSSDSGGSPGGSPGRSTSARTYMCKICGNLFTSGQSLGGHMNVHRNDQRTSSPQSSAPAQYYDNYYSSGTDNPWQSSSSSSSAPAYKGVRSRKGQNKWVAEIRPPRANNTWWLGTYSTPEEAAYAYDVAITYFGSESSLNFAGHPTYEHIPRISTDLQRQDYAAELRSVVKKYGKLAMDAGSTGGAAGASTSRTDEAPEELGWEDFHPPPGNSASDLTDYQYSPFDFEETTGGTDSSHHHQAPAYDQANWYYGHGYQQQHYGWSPFHDPKDS